MTVNVLPPACSGQAESFGFGCAAAAGIVPVLSVTGCPEPGGELVFEVTGGAGGAASIFAQGSSVGVRELSPGCVLRVGSISVLTPVVLSPGGQGHGSVTIPVAIPVAIPQGATGTLAFQMFIRDPSPGYIGSFTNTIVVTLP